ncbi:hypothetical protein [Clostridium estertheticum]|uniref:hypothetical protein n=1 Tax=Clostridium estertheticum TaxID=238834 RepID=UPI001CF4B0DC|nr:hypothetical protein [Clostridium estertheticum]MCB2354358.1 hypothetical protein [Clostridium estertheticum]WAG42523.1 hypothetical protein LL065_07575 [Clostridium estertheticum]
METNNNNNNNNKDIKIIRLEGSDVLKIQNGWNMDLEFKTVLPHSLLKAKLGRLHVNFSGHKSKEIIGVNFNYGFDTERLKKLERQLQVQKEYISLYKSLIRELKRCTHYKDAEQYLIDMLKEIVDNKELQTEKDKLANLDSLIKIEKDKWNKDRIRENLYQNGFKLTHKHYAKGLVVEEEITYKFWFRTPAKSRVGDSIFISETIYNNVVKWQNMGLILPEGETKVVEFQAYRSLTASHIEKTIEINGKNILVLSDLESYMNTNIISVEMEDYKTQNNIDRCAKLTKTYKAEKTTEKYKIFKGKVTKQKCVAISRKDKVKNVLFDGMAILDEEYFSEGDNFYLLRQHMFKACAFKTGVVRFLKDKYGADYETATVKNRYGFNMKVSNIRLITTENAMKMEKFAECGATYIDGKEIIEIKTKKQMYSYWKQLVKDDRYMFGICKKNHSSKYLAKQRMSYQMVNTLLTDANNTKELAQYTVDYLEGLKDSDELFIKMLSDSATDGNNNNLIVDLYNTKVEFKESNFYKDFKTETISSMKKRARVGKLLVEGDNLTVCSNPYLLLLHACGEVSNIDNVVVEGFEDPTLPINDKYISCYTERFEENEELANFRNPHNAPNNCILTKVVKHDLMKKYFDFGKNIIAINCVSTEAEDLANSMDFDSDFMLSTNNKIAVKAVKSVFRNKDYACIVNNIPENGKKWLNNNLSIAKIDNLLAQSKNDIGVSSNMAQLALSYYQHDKTKELRDIVCIMSVLAQVSIDNAKRQYAVNVKDEIARICELKCIKVYDNKIPSWMQYIKKDVKKSRLLKVDECNCTMEYLQKAIDEIKNLVNNVKNTKIGTLLVTDIASNNKTNYPQIKVIEDLILSFDKKVKYTNKLAKKYSWKEDKVEIEVAPIREDTIGRINRLILTEETMYYLVKNAIHDVKDDTVEEIKTNKDKEKVSDSKKYKRKMLNILYNTHKELFLSVWK